MVSSNSIFRLVMSMAVCCCGMAVCYCGVDVGLEFWNI